MKTSQFSMNWYGHLIGTESIKSVLDDENLMYITFRKKCVESSSIALYLKF